MRSQEVADWLAKDCCARGVSSWGGRGGVIPGSQGLLGNEADDHKKLLPWRLYACFDWGDYRAWWEQYADVYYYALFVNEMHYFFRESNLDLGSWETLKVVSRPVAVGGGGFVLTPKKYKK